MNSRIGKIIDIYRGRDIPFCIRADGFQPVHTLEEDLPRIKLWVDIAQSLTKEKTYSKKK